MFFNKVEKDEQRVAAQVSDTTMLSKEQLPATKEHFDNYNL